MASTFVYFSALCAVPHAHVSTSHRILPVVVKQHLYGAQFSGFNGKPVYASFETASICSASLGAIRRKFQNRNYSELGQVGREDAEEFANWVAVACQAHGEGFPTWVGDLYLKPSSIALRGYSPEHYIGYLVTEAPGLDCGSWEGDQLPVRG